MNTLQSMRNQSCDLCYVSFNIHSKWALFRWIPILMERIPPTIHVWIRGSIYQTIESKLNYRDFYDTHIFL